MMVVHPNWAVQFTWQPPDEDEQGRRTIFLRVPEPDVAVLLRLLVFNGVAEFTAKRVAA